MHLGGVLVNQSEESLGFSSGHQVLMSGRMSVSPDELHLAVINLSGLNFELWCHQQPKVWNLFAQNSPSLFVPARCCFKECKVNEL